MEEALGNSKSKVHEKRASDSEVCDAGKILACQWCTGIFAWYLAGCKPCKQSSNRTLKSGHGNRWKRSISSCSCRRSNSATVRFRTSLCLPACLTLTHSHTAYSTAACFLEGRASQPPPPRRPHTAFSRARIKRRQAFRFRAARSEEVVAVVVDTS